MASSDDFSYLSYIILFTLLLYAVVLSIFLCIRRKEVKNRMLNDRNFQHRGIFEDSSLTFDWTTNFETISDSFYGPILRPVLALLRTSFTGFFFIMGIIIPGNINGGTFNYFDGWNMILIFLYFLLASCTTILSAYYSRTYNERDERVAAMNRWGIISRFFAVSAHLLFEVAGSTSILILVGDYTGFASPIGTLKIPNMMAVTALLVDMCLNNIRVRFDQFPAAIAWVMLYLLIIWPAVFTGSMLYWPYSFLQTNTPSSFLSYLLLYVVTLVAYTAWYSMYKAKKYVLHRCGFQQRSNTPFSFADDYAMATAAGQYDDFGTSFYSLPSDTISGNGTEHEYHDAAMQQARAQQEMMMFQQQQQQQQDQEQQRWSAGSSLSGYSYPPGVPMTMSGMPPPPTGMGYAGAPAGSTDAASLPPPTGMVTQEMLQNPAYQNYLASRRSAFLQRHASTSTAGSVSQQSMDADIAQYGGYGYANEYTS